MIDLSVRLGDILVILSLVGSGVMYAFKSGRFAESIANMQKEIVALKEVAKTIGDVLTMVAVQKTEIKNIQDDIKEMKHGEGFIRGPQGIDREYK